MRKLGIALALGATTFGADAAGLGRLNLMSGLGQPLRAEIELTQVSRDDGGILTAKLAGADAFSQAGIEYGSALGGLRFSIQRRANGQQYVLVTSTTQVNEPFLDLLVELTWGSGRLVREYTVLLDPPETRTATRTDAATPVVQAQAPAASGGGRRAPRGDAAASTRAASAGASSSIPVPSATSSGDYVVKTGDTAMALARGNKPEDASLDQTLAALYGNNPQAFSGSVDRLIAGATLHMPDAAAAKSVPPGDARRVIAQSSNFAAYRDRLARDATPASGTRAPSQEASGRLSTQVQDQAAPGGAADRLQLSRAERAGASGATRRTGAGPATAEELAAKDRELAETRTRLAQLEKNFADLQELLKLKNQTLADLQKGAGAQSSVGAAAGTAPAAASSTTAPTAVPPSSTPVATTTPAPVAPPLAAPPSAPAPAGVVLTPTGPTATAPPTAATTAATAGATPPATDAPVPPPAAVAPAPAPAKVAPAPVVAPDPGIGDWIADNLMLVVGLLALVVALVGYVLFRRRKLSRFEDSIFVDNSVLHANSVFGTTGGQSVDTANSGFHSNFVPVAGALPEHSEVDPVAEADVYIAYGRDAQAEEILKEALRADGTRQAVRLKLLEIYAKRGDAKTFETMATELYAATGGVGEEWRQAAALGASIDPRNPLYIEPTAEAAVEPHPASLASTIPLASPAPSIAPVAYASAEPAPSPVMTATEFRTTALDFTTTGLGVDATATNIAGGPTRTAIEHMRTDPLPRPSPTAATSAPSMDLDFDLDHDAVAPRAAGVPTAAPAASGAPPAAAPAPAAASLPPSVEFDGTPSKPLADPFTASAFGSGDATARTAVNLPAFRARADQPAEPPPGVAREPDGFTASDIFGSSIISDAQPMYDPTPPPTPAAPRPPSPATASTSSFAATARTSDFRATGDDAFLKTEPFDAFSKVNLDLDQGDFAAMHGTTEFGARTDVWQAMATKLDLALAYSDIGDKDGARELLEEVVRNGDQAQADRARQLITELG